MLIYKYKNQLMNEYLHLYNFDQQFKNVELDCQRLL